MNTLSLDDDNSILVSLGGDDGSVSVVSLNQNEHQWVVNDKSRFPLAHAGCIVATRWLVPDKDDADEAWTNLASLGSDGRLILWKINNSLHDHHLSIYRSFSLLVTVTDPHSMTVAQDPLNKSIYWFYIVGLGAQLLNIDLHTCYTDNQ